MLQMLHNSVYFHIFVFVLLFQPFVHSDVTYTYPNKAVYDDSSSQFLSSPSNTPIQRYVNFSGLSALSSSAVITVQIWLRHTYNADVEMRLYSPDGTYIILSNRRGGANDNVFDGTLFTDSASTTASSYPFSNNVVATPLKPEQLFSSLRGKDPNGQWKIWLNDGFSTDDGYLNRVILTIQGIFFFFCKNFSLETLKIDDSLLGPIPHQTTTSYTDTGSTTLTYNNSVSSTHTFSGLVNPLSNYAIITLQIWVPHTYSGDCVVTLMGPTGTSIYITNRRGSGFDNVFDGTLFTDSAPNSVSSYSFTSNGVVSPLKPEQLFSNFRGKNPNGEWRVDFSDNASGDDGKVNKIILTIQGKNY